MKVMVTVEVKMPELDVRLVAKSDHDSPLSRGCKAWVKSQSPSDAPKVGDTVYATDKHWRKTGEERVVTETSHRATRDGRTIPDNWFVWAKEPYADDSTALNMELSKFQTHYTTTKPRTVHELDGKRYVVVEDVRKGDLINGNQVESTQVEHNGIRVYYLIRQSQDVYPPAVLVEIS